MRLLVSFLLLAAVACVWTPGTAGAPGGPDLRVAVHVLPADPSGYLAVGSPARVVLTVTNAGAADAGEFEVDLWCSDPTWSRHSVTLPSLPAGSTQNITDAWNYTVAEPEAITFFAEADPANRIDEVSENDNSARLEVPFAQFEIVHVDRRLAGNATLARFSLLVFVVDVVQGESILFQAEAAPGEAFDEYLFDEINWRSYQNATSDSAVAVSYFHDYYATNTTHAAFTTSPLPAGRYFLAIENDDRLHNGARPVGPVQVTYAVATLDNALPPALIAIIVGAAVAAIWATVKWRPAFEVHSPLLEVPAPDPAELGEEDEGLEMDEDPETGGPPPEKTAEPESTAQESAKKPKR